MEIPFTGEKEKKKSKKKKKKKKTSRVFKHWINDFDHPCN